MAPRIRKGLWTVVAVLVATSCASASGCNAGTGAASAPVASSVAVIPAPATTVATPASSGTGSPTPSATPPPPVSSRAGSDPFPPRSTSAWPLAMESCDVRMCKLPDGSPGLTCSAGQACFNPCLPGTGPEQNGTYCSKLCKTNADCRPDTCAANGVCDRWPPEKKDARLPSCKRGLVLYGGTHCVKPCKRDADCPGGGNCEEKICGPLCPSEGCPYRWE